MFRHVNSPEVQESVVLSYGSRSCQEILMRVAVLIVWYTPTGNYGNISAVVTDL
jgi:hypothetical protein